MAFAETAKRIVSDSIRSAICIDDNFLQPYETKNDENNKFDDDMPRKLYNDFKNPGKCTLDIFRFNDIKEVNDNIEYIFKNRDLLVLDWELNSTEPKYKNALDIIKTVIEQESLHFICIYTNVPKINYSSQILYKIVAFFSGYTKDSLNKKYECVKEKISDKNIDDIDIDKILDKIAPKTLDLFSEPDKKSDIILDIEQIIKKEISDDSFKQLVIILKGEMKGDINKCYEQIGYLKNAEIFSTNEKKYKLLKNNKDTLIINNTIIKVLSKEDVKPEALYETLTSALVEGAGNFLTLMSLEMKNMLRDSSAFMKSYIDQINELAFFYHEKKIHPSYAFFEFLKEIWKEEATSVFIANEPTIFNELDDYKKSKGVDEELSKLNFDDTDFQKNLAQLNFLYNDLKIKRPDTDTLKFGDIFRKNNVKENEKKQITSYAKTDEFLLCITPHCDCLYPININYNFHFIKGKEIKTLKGLMHGDAGFCSYLNIDNEIKCIEWDTKPFTIYINDDNNKIKKDEYLICYLGDRKIALKHISVLKDNYTQRLANKSFGHPLRVGINFAHLKDSSIDNDVSKSKEEKKSQ